MWFDPDPNHASLSDKERELIVDRARKAFLAESDEAAFAIIDEAIQNNLSDGLLYKEIAGMLYGYHSFRKSADPTIYLDRIATYYERAMELLPEQQESISLKLISIYAALGEAEKAEEAWSKLRDTSYDKEWEHAEMLYSLKKYDAAIPKIKEIALRSAIDLSYNLGLLRSALALNGNDTLAAEAQKLSSEIRDLFAVWEGYEVLNRVSTAITASDIEAEREHISAFVSLVPNQDNISAHPLFSDVKFGGASKDESTTVDLMADLMQVLKNRNQK